jgi:hypothetical protein
LDASRRDCEHPGMDSRTSVSRGRLEHAEALLREVIIRDFDADQTGEAGSLGRILIHIVNMHRAVSTSSDEHRNVAKRLGDFALVLRRVTPPTAGSAVRLTRLAGALDAARSGLQDATD